MKASGPRIERETIILFNEAEDFAEIWTASQPMYRKLTKLYPVESDTGRGASFKFLAA